MTWFDKAQLTALLRAVDRNLARKVGVSMVAERWGVPVPRRS